MAGMAAAEAAPWLVVRLRGVLCTVEALLRHAIIDIIEV